MAGWALYLVSGHTNIGYGQKFVHFVRGHSPGQSIIMKQYFYSTWWKLRCWLAHRDCQPYSKLRNVRAAWLPFQPSHLFVLLTAEHQHLPKWAPAWFSFSGPYLHTLTSPFPRIKMLRSDHWRHIPEPVKGIFVTMSCQMSSKDISIWYIWHWCMPQTNTCLSCNGNWAAPSFHNPLYLQSFWNGWFKILCLDINYCQETLCSHLVKGPAFPCYTM